MYVSLSLFFLLPGSGSTFPEVDPDPDPAKWYKSNRIRIRKTAFYSYSIQYARIIWINISVFVPKCRVLNTVFSSLFLFSIFVFFDFLISLFLYFSSFRFFDFWEGNSEGKMKNTKSQKRKDVKMLRCEI